MKVHSPALEAYSRTALTPVGSARPPAPTAEAGSSEAAHVTVSAEARALAAQHNGIDEQKVEALRNKIAEGELRINPQQLAMRLLDALG